MKQSLPVTLAIALVLVGASALSGQTLAPGTWTGTMSPPNDSPAAVTFTVTGAGDSLAVTMNVPGMGTAPFNELRWDSGKLLFQWHAGDTLVKCALASEANGGYKGPCTDDQGGTGTIEMVPPSKP